MLRAEANYQQAHQADTDLARVVRVNEEIKGIVGTASKINLMALNALFLANRAGQAARGFGVLSNELRRFSEELTRQMRALGMMTVETVTAVTDIVHDRRLNGILDQALAQCPEAATDRGPIDRRRQARMAARSERLRRLDKRLRFALEETTQLVELGAVLARSAKIEAAYGGRFSEALTQVSTDFGAIIVRIQDALARLSRLRVA